MNEQPKALRLADALNASNSNGKMCDEAATELRRLHEENTALRQALNVDAIDTSENCVDETKKREHEPVAWVRDLTSPQPHCVTSLKYRSVADTDAGVKYIPVYVAPPSKPWVSLTGDEIDDIAAESGFGYINVARAVEAALKEKNT